MARLRLIFCMRFLCFTFFCLITFFCLFLFEATAEVRSSKDDFGYSGLSVLETQQEIKLLNKYAKKAYADNDFELSKLLFYRILELDSDHPEAKKYLNHYIPKKIGRPKRGISKAKRAVQEENVEEMPQDKVAGSDQKDIKAVSPEVDKKIREKHYAIDLKRIAKEEELKRVFELRQRKNEEVQRRKQLVIEKKEQARRQKEKQLAAKKALKLTQKEKDKNDAALKEELNRLVREEERERRLKLKQGEKRKESSFINQDAKEKIIKEPTLDKGKEAEVAQKKPVKLESADKLTNKIVETEMVLIQHKEKRLAKDEAIRKKVKKAREKREMAELKRQERFQSRRAKSLAKLSKKTSKEQAESEFEVYSDTETTQEDLEKYLLEQMELDELKHKEEDASKDAWDKVKALYKEGVDSYKAGNYEKAIELFDEVLSKNEIF